MIKKLMYSFGVLFWAASLLGQTSFPYTISLEPYNIPGLVSVHSYAYAQNEGKWLIIGGRLDGIHARQPFNAFPAAQNNTTLQVVDPESKEVWSASINALPTGLKEQLQATNMQFFQEGDLLLIVGGYAYSESASDHLTFPYLTTVNVPGLINAIIAGTDISQNFQQITDEVFAVTGGYLGKIDDEYYLVGGHRFDGRYNPMNHPTFVQTYTDGIKKFTLSEGDNLAFENYSLISDPVNLHRRDYNLLAQIYPDGAFGYTIFSGVFQITQDLPFLYPVDIRSDGHSPIPAFNQYLSNYHSAHIALFDEGANHMHNLFFGGISQYYYEGETMFQDANVPFVKTISRVSRDANGALEEVRLPIEMPAYLGASAELIINPDLPQSAPDIVNLSEINADSFVLGYIFGGIESQTQNPFSANNTGTTSASTTLFRVSMVKNETTATEEVKMPGYHDFTISVSPNPSSAKYVEIATNAPEAGNLDIFLTDSIGKQFFNAQYLGLQAGATQVPVNLPEVVQGVYFLTVVLNGKYVAVEKIICE